MRWRPLSARSSHDAIAAYDALHDGIPPWMAVGAAHWLVAVFKNASYRIDLDQAVHYLEQALRLPLNWPGGTSTAIHTLADEVANNKPRALDVLDGVLMLNQMVLHDYAAPDRLSVMLLASGSAWTVGRQADGTPCLQRRVDSTTEAAVRIELSDDSRAGHHLNLSWDNVYGRRPDASGAYREAVRAVEAAARPVVAPNDPVATLGKMIRAIDDKPSKWRAQIGSVESVNNMLKLLWTSQLDRHGTDDESVPLSVSGAEAEAAVHLAMTLVHWFRSGGIRLAS